MRKLTYFSVLLLLIGLILISSSAVPQQITFYIMVAEEIDKPQAIAYLEERDNFTILIYPSAEWKFLDPPTDDIPYDHIYVPVNITDPSGNYTTLTYIFVRPPDEQQLYIYEIQVKHQDGIIGEENQAPPFMGTAKYSGNYTIQVLPCFPPQEMPPSMICVSKKQLGTIRPYGFLLPVGVATSIFGLAAGLTTMVWYTKISKSERKARSPTRK